jgi:hypothetical protein
MIKIDKAIPGLSKSTRVRNSLDVIVIRSLSLGKVSVIVYNCLSLRLTSSISRVNSNKYFINNEALIIFG